MCTICGAHVVVLDAQVCRFKHCLAELIPWLQLLGWTVRRAERMVCSMQWLAANCFKVSFDDRLQLDLLFVIHHAVKHYVHYLLCPPRLEHFLGEDPALAEVDVGDRFYWRMRIVAKALLILFLVLMLCFLVQVLRRLNFILEARDLIIELLHLLLVLFVCSVFDAPLCVVEDGRIDQELNSFALIDRLQLLCHLWKRGRVIQEAIAIIGDVRVSLQALV